MIAAAILVVGLVGAFGGAAAAMDFDDRTDADTNETSLDSDDRNSAATNDTLAALGIDVGVEPAEGNLRIDCTGELLRGHDCDKAGLLDLGVIAIDYDGAMGGRIAELGYWFDDHIVVYLAGTEAQLEFSCEMSPENVTCPVEPHLSLLDADDLEGVEDVDPGNGTVVDLDDLDGVPESGSDGSSLGSLLEGANGSAVGE